MTDEFLESSLWKNPSLVIKAILDAITGVNSFPSSSKTYSSMNAELHVGRLCDKLYISDGLDLFRCNRAIAAIPAFNYSCYKTPVNDPIFFPHRVNFTPFSELGNEELISILKHFFCSGHRLDLVKSRWSPGPKERVVDECWGLQEVCSKLGVDVYSLCITINL